MMLPQKLIASCNGLKSWTIPYREVQQGVENVKALLPEVLQLGDSEMLTALQKELCHCDKVLSDMEVRRMLSKEMDGKNCFRASTPAPAGPRRVTGPDAL
jgi:peptide chain release factor 2